MGAVCVLARSSAAGPRPGLRAEIAFPQPQRSRVRVNGTYLAGQKRRCTPSAYALSGADAGKVERSAAELAGWYAAAAVRAVMRVTRHVIIGHRARPHPS